ncbi:unnamed protein product [Linum tenue]|uniref:RIN4 pathogenic type III effector avirulence factor Avr cleavage site domain-containing protein n=1 Tax=Linum tenue TaxID=586396 RepID=A0AAV0KYY9_9ROSI|nr:unnamed protein product [Linum tenue]
MYSLNQPDKGAAVPKFGDWDENNPASADGYTHIFNMVREERQGGVAGRGPGGTYGDSSHGNARKHNSGETTLVVMTFLSQSTYLSIYVCLDYGC